MSLHHISCFLRKFASSRSLMANDNDYNSNHSIATTVEKIELGGRKGGEKKKKKK